MIRDSLTHKNKLADVSLGARNFLLSFVAVMATLLLALAPLAGQAFAVDSRGQSSSQVDLNDDDKQASSNIDGTGGESSGDSEPNDKPADPDLQQEGTNTEQQARSDASARDSRPEYLQIQKTVQAGPRAELEPGQTFEYEVQVSCSEQNCVDAKITETLPNLDGFHFENMAAWPSDSKHTITWKNAAGDTIDQPENLTQGDYFEVNFEDEIGDGQVGMAFGKTFHISLGLKVPADFSPLDARNGVDLINTAKGTATNARDVEASATINVKAERSVNVALTKTWEPASQPFSVGAPSKIILKATNNSNVPVDTMKIVDPVPEGANAAATLAAGNPFRIVDFVGFDGSVMPAGATAVQVDAYAFNGTTWNWVPGTAGANFVLPTGVTAENVGGLRFTFTGEAIAVGSGSAANIELNVAQRANDRIDGKDLSKDGANTENIASAQTALTYDGSLLQSPVVEKKAPFRVTPPKFETTVVKSFDPNKVSKGVSTQGKITATNNGSSVETLTVTDLNYFDGNKTGWIKNFDGFTNPITYPAGAISGAVTYYFKDGGEETVSFASASIPAAPSAPKLNADVTGFAFTFSSDAGTNQITIGANVLIRFQVATNGNAEINDVDTSTNKATSKVVAANGNSANASNNESLTVVEPGIDNSITKLIIPSQPVLPGQDVVAQINATAKPTVGTSVDKVTVTDQWDGTEADFWNAFDITSIRSTEIPAHYTLKVEVKGNSGWVNITDPAWNSAAASARFVSMDEAAFQTKVGNPSQLTGIRFTYEATAVPGNVGNLNVRPNIGFKARETVRQGITPHAGTTSTYKNTATVVSQGSPPVGPVVIGPEKPAYATDSVRRPTGLPGPGGPDSFSTFLGKTWERSGTPLKSLTGEGRYTSLRWNVDPGHTWVTLADPGNTVGSVQNSVFNAFNLTGVSSINVSDTPFSNGWYLKWDKITKIELYNSVSNTWVESTAPGGSWQQANGAFKGLTLSQQQQRETTGIRIRLEENAAARSATTDPLAPAVGTGVTSGRGEASASNATNREFRLNWQLRDQDRNSDAWVIQDREYNVPSEKSIVRNTVELRGDKDLGRDAGANIMLLDPPANVVVTKTSSPNNLVVPFPGTVAEQDYPRSSYEIVAKNGDVSKAKWIRVIDPNSCSSGDCLVANTAVGAGTNPWADAASWDATSSAALKAGDPFNRSNITKLTIGSSKPGQVALASSPVWLLKYSGGTYSTVEKTVAEVNAYTAAELADVIGFGVAFTSAANPNAPGSGNGAGGGGLIDQTNNLSIKVDTQLRVTERLSGIPNRVEPNKTVSSTNTVFAQLIRPEGVAPGDAAKANSSAGLTLSGMNIDVATSKTIAPGVVYEPTRNADVAVALKADQGTSNSSPWEVVIEDFEGSTDFWSVVNLKSLDLVSAPAGADQVQVDVHTGGASGAWVTGTATSIADAAIPAGVAGSDVDGLRFTFTKAGPLVDGKGPIFSGTNNPQWKAEVKFTVNVRDKIRVTDEDVTFPRAAVTNQVLAQSFGKEVDSSIKRAEDDLKFETGSAEIQIGKWANTGQRMVAGGSTNPWDIVIKNVGTGFVDLTQVVDKLPAKLSYIGADASGGPGVTYTLPSSGLVEEPAFVLSADQKTITFDWDDLKARLKPGEEVKIRVWLQLQPGVLAGEKVTNLATVKTAQVLDEVYPYVFLENGNEKYLANISVPDPLVSEASTTDYLQIYRGNAVQVYKGVKGSIEGAVNLVNPDQTCVTFVGVDGQNYYRSPCVANSKQGSDDDWVLRIANTGTTEDFDVFWVFDAFPQPADQFLVSGESRGSMYRPVLTGMPQVTLNENLDPEIVNRVQMQVTYSEDAVCKGTWSTLPTSDRVNPLNGGPCTANGEEWLPASDSIDWPKVTGMRVLYHDQENEYSFPPGGVVDITYTTKNVIKDSANPEGAANVIPVPQEYAYNQFGASYIPSQGLSDKIAPNRVGVRLMSGSIQVNKALTGAAVAYAPDTFEADVSCMSGDTQLYFADPLDADDPVTRRVQLVKNAEGDGYTPVRIHGIPVGSVCTVEEYGLPGVYGESSRENPEPLTVLEQDTEFSAENPQVPVNAVPEAQIGTITNTYDWAGLSVKKEVDTKADKGTFGPFDFELTCKTSDNNPVTFPGEGEERLDKAVFTLSRDETWTAPEGTIPWGSTCSLTETNKGGAGSVAITGDNVTDTGSGTATVKVTGTEEDPTAVVSALVTNSFAAGTFTVVKEVTGAGGDTYGNGLFNFTATCDYNGKRILNETFDLLHGESKTFGVFPAGAACAVVENTTGGATNVAMTPADGKVTIAGPEGTATIGSTTAKATNRFDVGELKVTKQRDGSGADVYGYGPFEAQVACTYEKDGTTTEIELADEGKLVLSAENDYTASIGNIIAGATCDVIETDAGSAHETVIDPLDGEITIAASDEETANPNEVTITNFFHTGSLKINKIIDGAGAEKYGVGPFEAQVACSYDRAGEETPIELPNGGLVTLSKENGYSATLDTLYLGAECSVEETNAGGAHKVELSPADGIVTIDDQESAVEMTITNTFEVGELQIIKKVVGAEANTRGVGPFKAQVACAYEDDEGESVDVELPDDGLITLSRANGYRATVENIYAGSECVVVETDAGGADKTTMDPEDGKVSVDSGKTAKVTITNEFGAKKLPVTGAQISGILLAALALLGGGAWAVSRNRRPKGRHA